MKQKHKNLPKKTIKDQDILPIQEFTSKEPESNNSGNPTPNAICSLTKPFKRLSSFQKERHHNGSSFKQSGNFGTSSLQTGTFKRLNSFQKEWSIEWIIF